MRRIVTSILVLSLVLIGTRALQYAHQAQHAIETPACASSPDHDSHGPTRPKPGHSGGPCQLCMQLQCVHLLPGSIQPIALVSDCIGTRVVRDMAAPPLPARRRLVCRGPPAEGLG